jgi:predicted alpha-1,6-mannanase (GH76 family)
MTPSVALVARAHATVRRRFEVAAHRGLLHEHAGGGRRAPVAFNWSFAHAFAAALDVYSLSADSSAAGIDDLVVAQQRYWERRRRAGVPAYSCKIVKRFRTAAKFYDDNAWCGLNLMRLHRIDPTRAGLVEQAAATFDFAYDDLRRQSEDDAAPCARGGVRWQQQRRKASPDIGTVANAANAQLALRLYEATGEARHLDAARELYSWVDENMRDPSNHLFWDHVTPPDCHIDKTQWSYNQGLMIGAGVLLHRTTADPRYLHDARRTAKAALAAFDEARLADEPIEFAVILLRNLLFSTTIADSAEFDASVRRRVEQYAQTVWPRFAGDAEVLVDADQPSLIEQAAIVESMALQCWPAARYDLVV